MWAVRIEDNVRKCTNISSLYCAIGFAVIVLIFVIHSAINGNLNRLIQGYDDCGNICGLMNDGNPFDECGSHDKRNLPKLIVESKNYKNSTVLHFKCTEKCQEGFAEIMNRCWKSKDNHTNAINDFKLSIFQNIAQQLIMTWHVIALVCAISFVFSFIVLLLFRYFIEYIIWIVYILFVASFAASAVVCWILFATSEHKDKNGLLILSIGLTVGLFVTTFLLFWYRKQIRLIAQLFKEASKALIDIPTILFEPVMTFLALAIVFIMFMFFAIAIETGGELVSGKALDHEFQAKYEPTFSMYMARILNIIAFIWFTQFIFGCQCFMISGSVSKWYFSRDKAKLDSPIWTTFKQLVRFHLGSICLGSTVIMLVKIVKMIVNGIKNQSRSSTSLSAQAIACCCSCLIEKLDQLLQYLIRNAYIIMAKDGTPFFESGKRSFDLLFKNLKEVIALNNFGDLILGMGQIFVILIAGFSGYGMMIKMEVNIMCPMIFVIIFSAFIANCFISVFEMTIDTIFICFCEDCEINDGISKPYYMSETLRDVLTKLKESAERKYNFRGISNIEDRNGNQTV